MGGFCLWVSWLLRLILELPPSGFFRRLIFEYEAFVEKQFVKAQAIAHNVGDLDPKKLSQSLEIRSDADTFFILGSGSSVGALLPENFEEIRRQRSVGINTWGIHSFVPDIYALESVPAVGDGKDFLRSLNLLRRSDIVSRTPALLVLRPRTGDDHSELHDLPRELFERVFYYGRVSPTTRKIKNLRHDVPEHLNALGARYPGIFLDSGASVVRMMGLALAMGFRKIVLVGVDLNDSEYFWENNPDYNWEALPVRPVNNQKNSVHETTMSTNRAFSVIHMVGVIAKVSEAQNGTRVYVSSSKSELAKFLPQYCWASGEN
jgi:hypothetical protein